MPKMALYEYECPDCNQRFELRRAVDNRNQPATCPACGNPDGKKVISQPTVVFFGAGWTTRQTPSIPGNRRQAGQLMEGTPDYD